MLSCRISLCNLFQGVKFRQVQIVIVLSINLHVRITSSSSLLQTSSPLSLTIITALFYYEFDLHLRVFPLDVLTSSPDSDIFTSHIYLSQVPPVLIE